MKKLNKKGFSILELAIVVVVIGVIAGVGLYVKERKQNTAQAGGYTLMQTDVGVRVSMCRLGLRARDGARVLAVLISNPNGVSGRKARGWIGSDGVAGFYPTVAGSTRTIRNPSASSNNPLVNTFVMYQMYGNLGVKESPRIRYLALSHC